MWLSLFAGSQEARDVKEGSGGDAKITFSEFTLLGGLARFPNSSISRFSSPLRFRGFIYRRDQW